MHIFSSAKLKEAGQQAREGMASVLVNAVFSGGAFLAADRLIGSRTMRDSFIKAGLFGKDLNKTSEDRV